MADGNPPPAAGAGDNLVQRVQQLMMAVAQGNVNMAQGIADLVESLDDNQLMDLLMISAQFYLQLGADINHPISGGITFLMVASFKGRVDFVRFLITHGANPNQLDLTGTKCALTLAAKYGHLEVCRVLLEEGGAEVNQQTIDGATALIFASRRGHMAVVHFLFEHGAELQHIDGEGYSALMYAAKYGRTNVARFLLANGANADQMGNDGKRARDLAEEGGIAEMIDIFRITAAAAGGPADR